MRKLGFPLLILLLGILTFISCDTSEDENQNVTLNFVYPSDNDLFYVGDTVLIEVEAYEKNNFFPQVTIEINDDLVFNGDSSHYEYLWITNTYQESDYTIKATAISSEWGTTNKKIKVKLRNSKPEAKYYIDHNKGVAGQSINFKDKSLFVPSGWKWDFGDGIQSTEQNPNHTYLHPGTYDIKLIASNTYGSDTIVNESAITILDSLINDYEGNQYKIVQIGKQIWTKENLKSTYYADGEAMPLGSHMAYDNNDIYVDQYGRLYTVEAALRGATADTQTQGACPDGWHMPSKEEWYELADFLGGEDVAGGKLKETGIDHWGSPNEGATNESGFTAIGAGEKYNDNFAFIHTRALFWSSSDDWTQILKWYIKTDDIKLYSSSTISIYPEALSIRCIKDE